MSSSPTSSSSNEAQAASEAPFATLLDLECPVEMVLGYGSISVGACLELGLQSVIRLSTSAGEDLRVVVGGIPLLRGEVVLVEESAAVRITEIIPAPGMER
ncbi:MAG TPA: FliM/FliN family flagellar motor C-terminal domain-containing protein [Vicinamibacterales bacterium]|nr:FliM/FliN family flagellar motor C-terminal domain-containing protein [Vicinamibacterales bacterium]